MIIPGPLETTFKTLKEKIDSLEQVTPNIQIDLGDGNFVPLKSEIILEQIESLGNFYDFELHLMVNDFSPFTRRKVNNVSKVCIHIEALDPEHRIISQFKNLGYQVGICLNPETSLKSLLEHKREYDYLQFMTVHPGKQGNTFIEEVLEKIREYRKMDTATIVQVDGGVNPDNLQKILQAGADHVVIGSYIFGKGNPKQNFKELNQLLPMPKDSSNINTLASVKRRVNKIAFLGGAGLEPEHPAYIQAVEVAKILAENDYEILNGGGPGIMEASTKGAHLAGKRALAITYHPNKPKKHYEGVASNNDFDEEILTLDYFDRTKVMLQNSDVHIIFYGSIGTLSEFGMTWVSSWIHEPNSKPIILYGIFWNNILDSLCSNMLITEAERNILRVLVTPEEVLDYVKNLA